METSSFQRMCLENSEKVRVIPRSGLSGHESEDDFKFFC